MALTFRQQLNSILDNVQDIINIGNRYEEAINPSHSRARMLDATNNNIRLRREVVDGVDCVVFAWNDMSSYGEYLDEFTLTMPTAVLDWSEADWVENQAKAQAEHKAQAEAAYEKKLRDDAARANAALEAFERDQAARAARATS